jgi:hypothetical protein
MSDKDITLDVDWVQEFEKDEEIYKDFYKDTIESVRIFVLCVDKKNNLFHIKKSLCTLENSEIKKETLIKILKENMYHNEVKYRPISILKWNMDMEPGEVAGYLRDNSKFNFLSVESKINTLKFNDSINLFHNINSLYIVYHESWKSFNNRTKKIYIGSKKLNRRKTKYKRDLKKS